MPYSNGNSFSNGQSMDVGGRSREPWIWRFQRPIQDRRSL
jgi:hypothetical protein